MVTCCGLRSIVLKYNWLHVCRSVVLSSLSHDIARGFCSLRETDMKSIWLILWISDGTIQIRPVCLFVYLFVTVILVSYKYSGIYRGL